MKVLVVGATGVLGQSVTGTLRDRGHEVLAASRTGQYRIDLTSAASIESLYREVGPVDAVVCAAGSAPLAPLNELTYHDFVRGLANKALGQIELVRAGLDRVADGASFTLITGISAYEAVRNAAVNAAANGAIESFVRCAAAEATRGIRINSVCATIFTESVKEFGAEFPGYPSASTNQVAQAFVKSIEGIQTGQNYHVGF